MPVIYNLHYKKTKYSTHIHKGNYNGIYFLIVFKLFYCLTSLLNLLKIHKPIALINAT